MNKEQYSAHLQTNGGYEPAHLTGRGESNYAIRSAVLQSLNAEFSPARGPSAWFRAFDQYLSTANHTLLSQTSVVGKLVVHESIEGAAVFVGFDGVDSFILKYAKQGERRFSADTHTLAKILLATLKQIASAELDGVLPNAVVEVAAYHSALAKKRSKLAEELRTEQDAQDGVNAAAEDTEVSNEEHVDAGYASRKRPIISVGLEELIDLTDAN